MLSAAKPFAADQPNEYLGAQFGAYDNGPGRNVKGVGKGQSVLELAGEWHCELDPQNSGVAEGWYQRDLSKPEPIRLPGTLDEGGYGKPQENGLRTLSRHFSYIGSAWYQREVVIPQKWAGKRITLSFERVMWESRVWIDNDPIGARDSLCTPQEYDLTGRLTPGIHRLTVRVDNSGRPGAAAHGYGDDQQIKWNGLLGRLELRAQDAVYVSDAQIYPDVMNHQALVCVTVGSIASGSYDGTVTVIVHPKKDEKVVAGTAQANFKIAGGCLPVEVEVPLSSEAGLWDEFSPNLCSAEIEVAAEPDDANAKKTFDRIDIPFGMREFGRHGTQFTMNGRTLFLRGTHDGGGFPLTGHPAMDVAEWRRIFQICKEYGLNAVRYHSFCPPEEAFTAADEEGIMLQVELPYWGNVGTNWAGTPFLRAELQRILDTYGNHPSFCLLTMGNENSGDWDVLARFVDEAKRRDPRHFYAATSNEYIRMGKDHKAINPGDEFAVAMQGPKEVPGFELGRMRLMERLKNGWPADFDGDYRDITQQFDVPVIAHELGQYWVYPDLREQEKYRGVLYSSGLALMRESLTKADLLDRDEAFHEASGALSVLLYKADIEAELRTPGLAGFDLLDLHDYTGQYTASVGVLDAFWDSKGIVTPAEFRRFCSPTVVLLRTPKRVWTTGETLTAEIEIAHYGPTNLQEVTPFWQLMARDGRVLASGQLADQPQIATGQNTPLGHILLKLADLPAPSQLRLVVSVGQTTNDWTLWLYPDTSVTNTNTSAQVHVTDTLDASTIQFIENGGHVLFLGQASTHTVPTYFAAPEWIPWAHGEQSCGLLVAANHPAFAEFPTATHTDWQWWPLLEPSARAFVLNDLSGEAGVLAEVIDQPIRAFHLGALCEARVGKGVLLASSLDLDSSVEGRQLKRSLLDYLVSDRCQPALTLSAAEARRLFVGNTLQIVSGVPTNAQVMLDVEASVNVTEENASEWHPGNDRIAKRADGFDYDLSPAELSPKKVSWNGDGKKAWMASNFTVTVHCPTNFTGTVYLHFQDLDSGQANAVAVSGRDALYVGPHGGSGKWVALSVPPGAAKNGILSITAYKPAGGEDWSYSPRITRLIVAENHLVPATN